MYDNGYRLISRDDYLDMNIDIELGYTPILLTFDDGLSSTFSLNLEDDVLIANPDSAIGILEAFKEEHPDFGEGGCLFINDNYNNTFYGEGTLTERFEWLIDHGYDIGNHSATHSNFSGLSSEGLQKEIGKIEALIMELLPTYNVRTLSYPFGVRPIESLRNLALDGIYNEVAYNYDAAFAVGPTSPYYAPTNIKFNPLLVARVRGSEGETGDLWFYFDYYNDHPDKRYISDGVASTLVMPVEFMDTFNNEYNTEAEVIFYESIIGQDAQ
jgi:peptidoglycan/xylan/chitin deacetylase (PgdA/CDA1 family)